MTNGGEISVGGRFDRVELVLERIELKLDQKADLSRQIQLENHVLAIENGETAGGRMFLERYRQIEHDVNDVIRHGSTQAQEASTEIGVLKKELGDIETRVSLSIDRNRFWTILLSILNAVVLLANIGIGLAVH